MLTAHDNFTDRERAYKEGVDFFIGKPFTREIILKTIERLIWHAFSVEKIPH